MYASIVSFVLPLIWVFFSQRKIAKLEREVLARRTYDNDRNRRIHLAEARDACDEVGDANGFYETYGKSVSRLALDLEADLGAIEGSGYGYFGLVQTQDQIEKGRKHMEERGRRLREKYLEDQKSADLLIEQKLAIDLLSQITPSYVRPVMRSGPSHHNLGLHQGEPQ